MYEDQLKFTDNKQWVTCQVGGHTTESWRSLVTPGTWAAPGPRPELWDETQPGRSARYPPAPRINTLLSHSLTIDWCQHHSWHLLHLSLTALVILSCMHNFPWETGEQKVSSWPIVNGPTFSGKCLIGVISLESVVWSLNCHPRYSDSNEVRKSLWEINNLDKSLKFI